MDAPSPRLIGLALLVSAAGLLAGGCTEIHDTNGYIIDRALVASVQPGIDNRDSVQGTLGRPTFTSEFDQSTWYYLSRQTQQLAFANPKAVGETVLAVHFDKAGNVTSVGRSGLEQVASIDPYGPITPTLGAHRNFFTELFSNIGAVGSSGQSAPTTDNPNGGGGR